MNIYKISQNTNKKFDTYDSAVVYAKDEEQARNMNPATGKPMQAESGAYDSWCKKEDVKVVLIGESLWRKTPGVIVSSFNAG